MHKTTIPGNLPEGEKPQEFSIPAQYGSGSEPRKTLQDLVDEGAVKSPWMDEFDRSAIRLMPRLRDYQAQAVVDAISSPRLRIDSIMRESMFQSVRENLPLDSVAACDLAASEFEAKHGALAPGGVLYRAFIEAVATRRNSLAYDVWRETQALHSFGDGNRQLAVMGQSKVEGLLRRRSLAGALMGADEASRSINKRRRDALKHSAKWLARWKESRNGF